MYTLVYQVLNHQFTRDKQQISGIQFIGISCFNCPLIQFVTQVDVRLWRFKSSFVFRQTEKITQRPADGLLWFRNYGTNLLPCSEKSLGSTNRTDLPYPQRKVPILVFALNSLLPLIWNKAWCGYFYSLHIYSGHGVIFCTRGASKHFFICWQAASCVYGILRISKLALNYLVPDSGQANKWLSGLILNQMIMIKEKHAQHF